MEKKFKIQPPTMPNFLIIEMPPKQRQDGVANNPTIPVKSLTEEEAEEYAELMRSEFMSHWQKFQDQK